MKKLLLAIVIMALCATNAFATATVTVTKYDVWGSQRVVIGYVTLSAETYATGGVSLAASKFGLSNMHNITFANQTYLMPAYDYTNEKLILYRDETSAVGSAASTADSFFVLDADAAADEELVKVHTLAGCIGYLGTGEASLGTNGFVFARDSSSVLAIMDSSLCEDFGDTIFYDEDGATYRLYHNGSVTGFKDDILIPYDGLAGRVVNVRYSATASALGVALYIDADQSAADEKFTAVSPTDADGRFFANTTYSLTARTVASDQREYANGTSVTETLYFIAVGN